MKETQMNINTLFQSDYLKCSDLEDSPRLVTIKDWEVATMQDDTQKLCVKFLEFDKGLLLNKTNANNIAGFLGPETDHWIGKQVVMVPAMVDFQGKSVEAIRVRAPKTPGRPAAKPLQGIPKSRDTATELRPASGPPAGHPAAMDDLDTDSIPF